MSKMDNLRAMREARYEAAQKLAKSGPAKAAKPDATSGAAASAAPAKATKSARTSKAAAPQEAPATEALCGHRNMSGRTCTREQGHAAKSHRYS